MPDPSDPSDRRHARETEQKERLVFIDLLRLVAAVQMIQGHSVASVLAPAYRAGSAYATWMCARGLTSVIFLVSAGLSFAVAERRAHSAPARARRVRRALRLIAIGYLMHAPFALLFGSPLGPTLRAALMVDVLHCIGASLLALEGLSVLVPLRRARASLALGLALVCFLLAPATPHLTVAPAFLPLTNYVTTAGGSLFPLLPWSGFLLTGFALGTLVLDDRARIARRLGLSGAGALLLGLAIMQLGPALPHAVSPGYAFVKLGCVLGLASLFARLTRDARRLPGPLETLATETLFLYVSHVVVLYADHVGLEPLLRDRHGPLFGIGLTLLLLAAASAGALVLRSLRGRSRGGTRGAPTP